MASVDLQLPGTPPTLLLDIDDVICVNRPYTGRDALRALVAEQRGFSSDIPDIWSSLFSAPAVDVLNQLMHEFQPRVVITSSWLLRFNIDMLRAVFRRTMLERVATGFHEHWDAQQDRSMTRADSIARWMRHHHRGEPFAILDDAESGTGLRESHLHRQGHVVLCDVGVGLHPGHLPAIRSALSAWPSK